MLLVFVRKASTWTQFRLNRQRITRAICFDRDKASSIDSIAIKLNEYWTDCPRLKWIWLKARRKSRRRVRIREIQCRVNHVYKFTQDQMSGGVNVEVYVCDEIYESKTSIN